MVATSGWPLHCINYRDISEEFPIYPSANLTPLAKWNPLQGHMFSVIFFWFCRDDWHGDLGNYSSSGIAKLIQLQYHVL